MAVPVGSILALLAVSTLAEHDRRHGIVGRVVNSAAGAVDMQALVDQLDVNALLAEVDVNAVLADVDLNPVLVRVDFDTLLASIDFNVLLAQIDVDALLAQVDPDALLDRVDPDRLLDRVDVNRLLDRVDPDRLLDRVDPDRLLDRVDVNLLLDRVEPDRLLDRVDPDRLLDRVDVDRLMDRVDVKAIVDRAGIADIVADSTGAVAGSLLDVVRRQLVAIDTIADRIIFRVTARDPSTRPAAPPLLEEELDADESGRGQVTGHYAGPVTRLLAFAADMAIIGFSFTLMAATLGFVSNLFGADISMENVHPIFTGAMYFLYALLYSGIGLSLTGKTIGKALLGTRVVTSEGEPLHAGQAWMRGAVIPLSFLALGLGILMALISPRRATLHDRIVHTAVVYDWGDRPAELPAPITKWVAKRSEAGDLPPHPRQDRR